MLETSLEAPRAQYLASFGCNDARAGRRRALDVARGVQHGAARRGSPWAAPRRPPRRPQYGGAQAVDDRDADFRGRVAEVAAAEAVDAPRQRRHGLAYWR